MLLSFRVANVLCCWDEQVLSFVVTDLHDGFARPAGIRERGKEISVFPTLGIYGANASGKSNSLRAMSLMRAAVLGSLSWVTDACRLIERLDLAHPPR